MEKSENFVSPEKWEQCIIKLRICGDGYTTFVEIDITQRNVLFNLINEESSYVFIILYLVVKKYYCALKCLKKKYYELVALVEKYERYELYYAKKSNKIKYRGRKWYINSDNMNYKRTNLEESFVNDYINQILKVNQNIIVSKNRRTKSQCIQMQNKRAFS